MIHIMTHSKGKFQLGESIRYFMKHIERIKQTDYYPPEDDILWARKRTEQITEAAIDINKVPFNFIDVGGQRSQRQKWFQCFEGESVNTILFFVSICEYDQTLIEDKTKNRVIEALEVFRYIVCHAAFRSHDVILFFNKNDILEEKIREGKKVTDYLPNMGFQGDPLNLQHVQIFFRDLFYKAAQSRMAPNKLENYSGRSDLGIYHHFTIAINTENIKMVFNDVKDMVLKENMEQLMLQ
jgi:guanine nucleotide-binding protein subunit alpha-12